MEHAEKYIGLRSGKFGGQMFLFQKLRNSFSRRRLSISRNAPPPGPTEVWIRLRRTAPSPTDSVRRGGLFASSWRLILTFRSIKRTAFSQWCRSWGDYYRSWKRILVLRSSNGDSGFGAARQWKLFRVWKALLNTEYQRADESIDGHFCSSFAFITLFKKLARVILY